VRVDTYATVERCVGMHVSKLQRCCHHMLCFEVGDCFDALVQVHVASAEVRVRLALPRPVAHLLLCNRQALSVVLDGLAEVPLRPIRIPEVPVRLALSRPVAHLLCNRKVLPVVLDGLCIVILRPIRVAEVHVRLALPRPVAHLLCNRQALRVVVDGLAEVPCESYALPRFPYAMPSPARSPTSVVRCSWWCSSALEKFPRFRHRSSHCGCHRPGRALLRCHAPPVGSTSKLL
jgi:hypothetical protein